MSNRKFGRPKTGGIISLVCPFCGDDMPVIRGMDESHALRFHLRRKRDIDGYQINMCLDYCSTKLVAIYNLSTDSTQMPDITRPEIAEPYFAGFEFIVLIHQASPQQAAMFTRRSPAAIWKRFMENNALLGHPYENKLPVTANPNISEIESVWTGWKAMHEGMAAQTMDLTEFFHLVDPWVRDFRLPQR